MACGCVKMCRCGARVLAARTACGGQQILDARMVPDGTMRLTQWQAVPLSPAELETYRGPRYRLHDCRETLGAGREVTLAAPPRLQPVGLAPPD
jgi:hypothetical protein